MRLLNISVSSLAWGCLAWAQNASLTQGNTISTEGLVANSSRFNTLLRVDNGTYGPPVEEVHYFYKYWPIGIAVSSTSRIFVCYTRGEYDYTVAEVNSSTTETPYPSAGLNLPSDALNTTLNGIDFGSANSTGLISVQALYITPAQNASGRPETLWLLDTGRPTIQSASTGGYSMAYAQPGGPKVVGVNLSNNSVYTTYTFPSTVHYPDSYMNDLRFDLRPGREVAYIVDSSNEGRNGFIMLNLTDGSSWRRLTQHPSVLRTYNALPSYQGHPFYYRNPGMGLGHQQEGLDGIQISPDGKHIYYSPLTSQNLYRIPTANLLLQDSQSPLAEQAASNNISWLGQRGGEANGFEGDSNGLVYMLMPTHNAVYYYNPDDLQVHGFIRDPRILWPDSASIGEDGYFYVIINQLPYQDEWNNGVNLRTLPGAILRAKLINGGSKIMSLL
ncbi:Major royal jelly-related protein [Cladophialophora carrionii]|uniref:Major royal jelly-related protein n=1 Tax=Cladophialophora carrionii TaxID=86049 RepID=A0A1C1CG46_9EURO|nr:Major royal jelly-related protein [Cladophialophora carrionii]